MLTLAFASVDTFADEVSPNQVLLGDWGGLRTRLYQQGVDFQLGYTTEAAGNTQGGDRHLVRNADQFNIGTTLDLDKLLGWSDARFQVTITDRNGKNLSDDDGHLEPGIRPTQQFVQVQRGSYIERSEEHTSE